MEEVSNSLGRLISRPSCFVVFVVVVVVVVVVRGSGYKTR